jgi:NhaP-type Na+/H+ or K+/H+ antiporter
MSANHQTDALLTTIGAGCGFIKGVMVSGQLSWEVVLNTIILSGVGALVGLLISHYGKRFLKKFRL